VYPEWLRVAVGELERGVREVPGPSANPRIVDYHRATSLKATSDEVPWCASFVCWCLEAAGVASTRSAAARSYLSWGVGVSVDHPPVGSVVVLSRGATAAGPDVVDAPGHVGFCWSFLSPSGVVLLGGNQGDQVSLVVYPRSRVLGIRWPA
jgi:uncharacterized protein (TIGR02594 family)